MSSKDKDAKSIQDKLKEFFKRQKNQSGNPMARFEHQFPEDKLRDISRESSLSKRLSTLKELKDYITERKLETSSVAKVWAAVEDLFSHENTNETRVAAFMFLQMLIRAQFERLQHMRAQFFRFIKLHDNPEDIGLRLDLLNCLTDNGKIILYFEEEVGPFLLNWFPDITKAGKINEYLYVMDNMIRFNASYLNEEIIWGFIQYIYMLCNCNTSSDTVLMCLRIMSNIVAYSIISQESLPKFIGALCRMATIEKYCPESWKTMKNLLGTHMGHSALYTMCRILQEPGLQSDTDLLRGAVFFIHMSLWSKHPLTNLHCPPSSVLPSFLEAIKSNQLKVAHEVIIGINHLICKYGEELLDPAWTIILEILLHIYHLTERNPHQEPNIMISRILHECIDMIEKLVEIFRFNGSIAQFYALIEECAVNRPESSVLKLILYLSQTINPMEQQWLIYLDELFKKYFRPDERTIIRSKVLEILSDVMKFYGNEYGDQLLDAVIIPHMMEIEQDPNVTIRRLVDDLLIDLCYDCNPGKCLRILEILDKLLLRPFKVTGDLGPISEAEGVDVKSLISGLINLFMNKIFHLPSSVPIKIYGMLVNFLMTHYNQPKIFANINHCRYMIFYCFLTMRADTLYRLGCPDSNGKYKYSSYLTVHYPNSRFDNPSGSPTLSPAIKSEQPICTIESVSLKPAFKTFITCLTQEKDWKVLGMVLGEIPKALQNKALILSKQGNTDLYLLVDALYNMLSDKTLNLPESLNVKINKPDFQAAVLQVLVNLASYHSCLDPGHQQKMIRCLMRCIQTGPRSAKQCISALTICTLEMREVMVKVLPEVLLHLSKMSATIYIAIPVLDFLSTLTQLPMVFANFVADQYMAVFAISLPYTNPFKYNHYTVSLAHHVIAVWFLKCRLPFRKDFVKFITNGLQTNVLVPFEETSILKTDLSNLNEDSSDRKRSASLTEQGSRRRTQTMPAASFHRPTPIDRTDKLKVMFYEELTETCIDLMAKYAFSPCSAMPKRLPTAEFLLSGGQSMSWLIGNKLVTVTTSGCSQKVLKHGLCDKCWTLCSSHDKNINMRTTRSGSNDNQDSTWVTRQNSNDKSNNNTSVSSPTEESKKIGDSKMELVSTKLQQLVTCDSREDKPTCACWCQGWAEVYVRRPTGDMSWVMRIQNQISFAQSMYEFPLNEMSTLFMPSLNLDVPESSLPRQGTSEDATNLEEDSQQPRENVPMSNPISVPDSPSKQSPSRQNSRDSIDDDMDYLYDDGSKSRNPVRRSNSSPEMSANWKNPFLQRESSEDVKLMDDDTIKKNKMYSKDMRVSCEAIPEEMGGTGTTPPSNEPLNPAPHHPSLLSCHSYPGSSPPKDKTDTKPYQTVPPSPNVVTAPPDFPKISLKIHKNTERPSNLPNLSNLVPLSAKPPQSPTQTSPRFSRHTIKTDRDGHEIQKSSSSSIIEKNTSRAKERKSSGSVERLSSGDPNQTMKRDRTHTISVMSPATRKPRVEQIRPNLKYKEAPKSGISPSFVFLQLYHAAHFDNTKTERPLLVGSSDSVQRAVRILDMIPPYETHKIGVLYIKEGQANSEVNILRNRFGSLRYVNFLQNLGTLIKLADVNPQVQYSGGLELNGKDGDFAYIWQDDIIRVAFHVATMMPNEESDPNCNNKKLHIGNNFVTIVYNESGEEYNINTIKGQFNFASVIIQPLDHNTNKVVVKTKDELADLVAVHEPKLVSDQNVAILVRQLALHSNLASLVVNSLKSQKTDPYASNWLERLRKIKHVRNRIMQEQKTEDSATVDLPGSFKKLMEDFTDYT